MSRTVQEIMEAMGKSVEASMVLERRSGSSYSQVADIKSEDINELRYYFDGALYCSVMRCLEVKLKGNWTSKVKKDLLLDNVTLTLTHPEGDTARIIYGRFIVAEAPEYDAAQNVTSIIAYDELYPSMQPYAMNLDWTNGITVKNYLIAILNKLGIAYDENSLKLMANADVKITSEKFLDIENDNTESAYTYRDVLDEIAKASGVTFVFKSSLGGDPFKLYAVKPTESGYVIDESNLHSVTVGAKYGPVKAVMLSREPQEDNVYLKADGYKSTDATVKISNVEIIEDTAETAWITDENAQVKELLDIVKSFAENHGKSVVNFFYGAKAPKEEDGAANWDVCYYTLDENGRNLRYVDLTGSGSTIGNMVPSQPSKSAVSSFISKYSDKYRRTIYFLPTDPEDSYTPDKYDIWYNTVDSTVKAYMTDDAYRETFMSGILSNVLNTEYYLYELDSFGIGFLNFGDIFTIKACDREGGVIGAEKSYKTIFMRTDMTIGNGIKEKSKLEAPQATSPDYSSASTTDKVLKKTMLKVDKQNQRITSVVKETDKKFSKFQQTVDGIDGKIVDVQKGLEASISATAEKANLAYSKAGTVEGQINGVTDSLTSLNRQIGTINNELDGLDKTIADKVSTEVKKDTTIEILAGQVNSKISGNYVTKAAYDNDKTAWVLKTDYNSNLLQTDQSIQAAVNRVQKLEEAGYITEAVCNSLIDQKSDSIALKVESSIKTESRNLLKNSACFENFTAQKYDSFFDGFDSVTNPYVAKDQTTLPSGQAQRILFMSANQNVSGFKYAGSAFVEAALGSENAGDVLKPKTTYTLSFWARMYDSGTSLKNRATLNLANAVYTGTGTNAVTIDSTRSRGASLTDSFSKVVIVFTTGEAIETFQLNFRLEGIPVGYVAGIVFSSLKLEVGNIATDWAEWSPTAADVEQSVQAKIDMCVQKDKNGKLTSAIAIEGNKISIKSDNFELTEDGTITKCKGAQITGGVISCGNESYNMTIGDGVIVHSFDNTTVGQLTTMIVPYSGTLKYYETLLGNTGICLAAPDYSAYVDDRGFQVSLSARASTINVSIAATDTWSYGSVSATLRSIIESDSALIISANRGANALLLEGKNIWLCGTPIFAEAIGMRSSTSYVYVVADKNTGEIAYLSVD